MQFSDTQRLFERRAAPLGNMARLLKSLHMDGPLLGSLLLLSALGLFVLYSAVGENLQLWARQCMRLAAALAVMLVAAQVPPDLMRRWAPWAYALGLALLLLVLALGDVSQGAQRWLDLGIRFQPSEIMKLAVPMIAAWYLHERQLPPGNAHVLALIVAIAIPAAMIALQPDLGTALLIAISGMLVIVLAGMSFRLMLGLSLLSIPGAWALWHFMHDYQRQRVLTLLNPDNDPLGAGYNIIQSKIAIGSGGLFGKGWTNGSQAQLDFLPERDTDFIFAVVGEELGLLGALAL
ncbi:MAG TPA: FtsW/RodA/SpoVE family cell cycle protein, partial [Woeseiaceae bacterium]|nr:FtsW/RodA/SpoVE family cell cycle protein [Woeseiaceae bacterium]